MSHNEIVDKAAKWLKKHDQNIYLPNCSIIAKDLRTATITGEIADVIGWTSQTSVLIEVKVSRSDFLKDFNKPFRKYPDMGMGELKYYLCPSELINDSEIPSFWGLLWIDEKGKIMIKKKAEHHQSNLKCERTVLISLSRRSKK